MREQGVAYCDAAGVERATFVGNSLGCPIVVEVASQLPETRREPCSSRRRVAEQPARTLALRQMATDAPREPLGLLPIAVRDYLPGSASCGAGRCSGR